MNRNFLLVIFLLFINPAFGQIQQDRFDILEGKLKELSKKIPALNDKVDISVKKASIQDFVRSIGGTNSVNLNVEGDINVKIATNFTNVTIIEILLFLCKKYDLDLSFIGTIISIVPYVPQPTIIQNQPNNEIKITYDFQTDLLSYDLKDDSLIRFAKEITQKSNKNVIYSSDLASKTLNGFIQNMPFENALGKLAFANDLKITATEDSSFLIEKKEKDMQAPKQGGTNNPVNKLSSIQNNNFKISINNDTLISLEANNAPIIDLLMAVSEKLNHDYFFYNEIKGNSSLKISNSTYEIFLNNLFNGTEYTFKKKDSLYLFGDRSLEGLRETRTIQLRYRTADKIIDYIPTELKKGVDIKAFPDQNSLILSGSFPRITEITTFLKEIDKVVPVVIIEVLIVDINNIRTVTTGIQAGLGDSPSKTSGQVYPNAETTLSSSAINDIITAVNGFGILNLGKVTPNFYVNIKAMEEQGILKLRSTPKLATLNGNEAKLTIGRTEYYLELTNNIIGTQNPQNIISQQYKPVNADLALTINPMVSGDEQITMDIKIKQSSFTARISPSAPPGTITRDFQSVIRVKNEEMVILGGLDENTNDDKGTGVPVVSRVPVLKWLFSTRTKSKGVNKLALFIKPTVVY